MNSSDLRGLNRLVGGLFARELPHELHKLVSECIPYERRRIVRYWLQDAAAAADGVGSNFELAYDRFTIDGIPITLRSLRPLVMLWIVMAARQYGLDPIRLEWMQAGSKGRSIAQSVRRAAKKVERYSRPLASVMSSFSFRGGCFFLTAESIPIRCTSAALAKESRDFDVTFSTG